MGIRLGEKHMRALKDLLVLVFVLGLMLVSYFVGNVRGWMKGNEETAQVFARGPAVNVALRVRFRKAALDALNGRKVAEFRAQLDNRAKIHEEFDKVLELIKEDNLVMYHQEVWARRLTLRLRRALEKENGREKADLVVLLRNLNEPWTGFQKDYREFIRTLANE